ncbi:YwbE family protein [Chloroflexota bacterium]
MIREYDDRKDEVSSVNVTNRVNIKTGLQVSIILKKDQRSRRLTEGIVKDILTKSPTHPHGIKVRLENGQVGRVKEIII